MMWCEHCGYRIAMRWTYWCKKCFAEFISDRKVTASDEKVNAEYATGKVDHNEMAWTQACVIAIRARNE